MVGCWWGDGEVLARRWWGVGEVNGRVFVRLDPELELERGRVNCW